MGKKKAIRQLTMVVRRVTIIFCIMQKSDIRAAVRIILNGGNLCGNAVLIALEVDNSVLAGVSAAVVTHGQSADVISSAVFGDLAQQ